MKNEIPRRNRLDLNTPAELAIRNAVNEVEKVGADPRLTEVVIMLSTAHDKLADYVDNITSVDNKKTPEDWGANVPEDWANTNSSWNTI